MGRQCSNKCSFAGWTGGGLVEGAEVHDNCEELVQEVFGLLIPFRRRRAILLYGGQPIKQKQLLRTAASVRN